MCFASPRPSMPWATPRPTNRLCTRAVTNHQEAVSETGLMCTWMETMTHHWLTKNLGCVVAKNWRNRCKRLVNRQAMRSRVRVFLRKTETMEKNQTSTCALLIRYVFIRFVGSATFIVPSHATHAFCCFVVPSTSLPTRFGV